MQSTSDHDWPRRVAILGVGLLGGSVAMSIRRLRPDTVFVGYSRNADRLADAVARGVVDECTESMAVACQNCDAIVVATPVDRIAGMVIEAAGHCPPECLITDVGSTKGGIVADVEADSRAAAMFVAAHPIAGSEKSGSQHALETLFDGKVIVLTPGSTPKPGKVASADQFWRMTGGNTITMSAARHDSHLAAISHVPHLVSAMVARMVPPDARSLVGSGWRDITRVAAGDPEMWTAICSENRAAIVTELDRLADEVDHLKRIVGSSDADALMNWLVDAKQIKDNS